MRTSVIGVFALVVLGACDNTGSQFRPQLTDAAGIQDLGELRVIPVEEYTDPDFDPTTIPDAVVYGSLGALENPGATGGATFTFRGNDDHVCVVLDPESVYWTTAMDPAGGAGKFLYEDNYQDDADFDLSVGLTAYYTGSPGVEIGDFVATYTDGAGQDHALEFNECQNFGYFGDPAHAGRASVESCDIVTHERGNISYTGLIETFALPIDDSKGNFAVGVFELPHENETRGPPSCSSLAIQGGLGECTFPNERSGGVGGDAFTALEEAFCKGVKAVNTYCEEEVDPDDPLCFEVGSQ